MFASSSCDVLDAGDRCWEHLPVPLGPERTHLKFIVVGWLFLAHALRDVVPKRLLGILESALAMFERFGIVRGRKPAGTEEFKEVVETIFARPSRFVIRRQRPSVDDHVIGCHRK